MKYIDMHTHTTASDGVYTPRQLIKYGISKGLQGIAITDHDTVDGIDEGLNAVINKKDFIVIPGIELSTEYMGKEVHILGYSINYKCENLLSTLSFLQKKRENRVIEVIAKLQKLQINITYDELIKRFGSSSVGRPHVAELLITKGYVDTIEEAFNKYLKKGCVAYVDRYKITPFEGINLIKQAGGVAVIAHPKLIKNDKIVTDIIKKGIDGIEVYHPEHNTNDQKKFLQIAKEYNLIITAGSDFHRPPTSKDSHDDLGDKKISTENIQDIIATIK